MSGRLKLSRGVFLSVCVLGWARGLCAQGDDPCLNIQTQVQMNQCESERYYKADAELNVVYRKVLAKYRSNAKLLEKLKLAQDAWLKFRDAHLESLYYNTDKRAYGSVYGTCRSLELIRLTIERTKELRAMLNTEEGDVCGFVAPN
jgi:uncharacterized protein YecT (DUF1311 family)